MRITVLEPGLLTTVQDDGRFGYQKHGVIVSGAMDMYSMKLGNIAVGNKPSEGVLEITLVGPSLKIEKNNLISITGANLSPTINDEKVPMGRPIFIKEDSILKFGRCISGCRAYLSIAGGFKLPTVMNSKSTYLRGNLGGKDGRALRKDDILEVGSKSSLSLNIIKKLEISHKKNNFIYPSWYLHKAIYEGTGQEIVRVFEDRQFKGISEKSINDFFSQEFTVNTKSDRMGYRLNGPKIELKKSLEMISEEVSFGTIQVPPDGDPIILLADRATAGGYPKICHVASVDLSKLVQLKPSDNVSFKKITLKEAEKLYLEREEYIEKLRLAIKLISL